MEWLCLPRFDSPSVFGSILDRDAGGFRLGPADVEVPADRRYLPGTMVLETSWGAPRRLDHRARRAPDRALAPRGRPLEHPPPLAHRLRRRSRAAAARALRERRGAGEARLRAGVRLRPARGAPGSTRATATTRPRAERRGLRRRAHADHRHARGLRGPARHGAHADEGGRHALRRALLVRAPCAEGLQGGLRQARVDGPPLAALARPRRVPRPPLAHLPPAQRAHAEGPLLRAHRGDGGRRHHLAARDARRRAQLGLPLHLDPRRHLHALGPLHAGLRLGGQRLLLLHRRRGRGRGGPAPDHVRDRRRGRARRRARCRWRATRARGRCGSATAPTTRTSTTCGAPTSTRSTCTRSRATRCPERVWPIVKKQVEAALANWGDPDRGIWEVRGDPKHFTSSKLMCWVALDRGARLAELREELDTAARWQSAADEIHADICANAVDERGVFCQHYDTDALDASVLLMPLVRFLPPSRRARAGHGAGDRRRADRGRPGAALPHGRDRRRARAARRAPSRSARSGWCRRSWRSASSSAAALSARSCSPTRARSASTRRRSIRARGATSATSRRRSPTWPSSTR